MKNDNVLENTRSGFFKNIRKEEGLDDFTVNKWKTELQKELPSFWEAMTELQRK